MCDYPLSPSLLSQAQVSRGDGSPARGEAVRVVVTINNGQTTLFDSDVASDSFDGSISLVIPVPINANCLKITVSKLFCIETGCTTCKQKFKAHCII